jgi:serine/threonine protein kinase
VLGDRSGDRARRRFVRFNSGRCPKRHEAMRRTVESCQGRGNDERRDLAAVPRSTQQDALKRLRDITRVDRFKIEIDTLSRLNHSNINKLVDYGKPDSAKPFLVMPVARGGDAETRLALFKGSRLLAERSGQVGIWGRVSDRSGGIAFSLRGCRTPIFSSWPLVFRRRGR